MYIYMYTRGRSRRDREPERYKGYSSVLTILGFFVGIIPWTVIIFGLWTQIVHQSMLIYKQIKGWFPFKKYKTEQSTYGLEKYKTWFTIQYWINHWYYIGVILMFVNFNFVFNNFFYFSFLYILIVYLNILTYFFLTKPYIEKILTTEKINSLPMIDSIKLKQLKYNTKHYSRRIKIYGFWGLAAFIIFSIGLFPVKIT